MLTKTLHENIQKIELNSMKKKRTGQFGTRRNSVTREIPKLLTGCFIF